MIVVAASEMAQLADTLRTFSAELGDLETWRATEQMRAALTQVRRQHRRRYCVDRGSEQERIYAAVSRYLLTGQVASAAELMRVCAGAGWLDERGQGVLADRLLRRRLFDMAATVRGRRSRYKAFRGLLQSYWAFPRYVGSTSPEAIAGWRELRQWLDERYGMMVRHTAHQPMWFRILGAHRHLLSETPCAPYAKALLRGNFDELQRAMEVLFIPSDSWLKLDAVLAQIAEAAARPDRAFRAMLPLLTKLACGEADLHLPAPVSQRALGLLVRRYALQEAIESDQALFQQVVRRIGEPNRDRAVWDAMVVDAAGAPCALTRQMVSDWLKDTRLKEFFREAVQGIARYDFWSLFAVLMDEVDVLPTYLPDGSALRVKAGELGIIIPYALDEMVSVCAWRDIVVGGRAAKLRARFSQYDVESGKRVMRSLLGIQGDTGG